MVTHQLQVERRTGKVRWPKTDVLPLCHATNYLCAEVVDRVLIFAVLKQRLLQQKEIEASFLFIILGRIACTRCIRCGLLLQM